MVTIQSDSTFQGKDGIIAVLLDGGLRPRFENVGTGPAQATKRERRAEIVWVSMKKARWSTLDGRPLLYPGQRG